MNNTIISKCFFTECLDNQFIQIQFKMKGNTLAILLSILAITQALKISQHQAQPGEDLIVGGYSELNLNNLPEDAVAVDQYLRKLHPDLKDAKLVSASRQVVAGFNYHYKYKSADGKRDWDFVVYKDLSGKYFENGFSFTDTLPNGQKITAMADPASAFVGNNYQKSSDKASVKVSAPAPAPAPAPTPAPPVSTSQKTQAKLTVEKSDKSSSDSTVVAYRDTFPNAVDPRPV